MVFALNLILFLFVVALVVGVILWLLKTAPFVDEAIKPHIRWAIIAITLLGLIVMVVDQRGVPQLIR